MIKFIVIGLESDEQDQAKEEGDEPIQEKNCENDGRKAEEVSLVQKQDETPEQSHSDANENHENEIDNEVSFIDIYY